MARAVGSPTEWYGPAAVAERSGPPPPQCYDLVPRPPCDFIVGSAPIHH